jgi:hypothetical protein
MARLDRSSTMAWVASDGAPVSRVILVVVVEVGLLPPSSGLPQEGSQGGVMAVDCSAMAARFRAKFTRDKALFIGIPI